MATTQLVLEFVGRTAGLKAAASQARKEVDGVASDATKAGDEAGKGFGKGLSGGVLGAVKKVAGPLVALFAVDKVKDFFATAYDEARESQKVSAQTAQVIKSTGGAAKVSAAQVGDLATAMSNKTGIDDEQIQSGQNMLLTFKNIRNGVGSNNKIFDESTKIMTDMSVATGQDMKSSALQLGKALNDPAAGLTKLTRVGVTFTDQQKAQVKALQLGGDANAAVATGLIGDTQTYNNLLKQHKGDGVAVYKELTKGMTVAQKKQFDYYSEGGHDIEAQKVLLKELKTEFGGSAEAQATAGEKMATAWANFQESVGTKLLPVIDAFFGLITNVGLPALSGLADAIAGGVGWFVKYKDVIGPVVVGFGAIVAAMAIYEAQQSVVAAGGIVSAFKNLTIVTKLQTAAQWLLNSSMLANPIGLIIVGVIALVTAFVIAYKKSETFRKIVNGAFTGIKAVAGAVLGWLTGAVSSVIEFVRKHWSLIKTILGGPILFAYNLIKKHWGSITGTFKAALSFVKGTFKKGWAVLKTVVTAPISAGLNGIKDVWNKIKGTFTAAKNWVKGGWKKSWSGAKSWMGDAVGNGRDKIAEGWRSARSKFTNAKNWVKDTWKKSWASAKTWMGDAVGKGRDKIAEGWTSARGKFTNAKNWVKDTWKKSWASAKTWMGGAVANGRDKIAEGWTSARSKFSAAKDWVKDKWSKSWSGVKDKMKSPIASAKDAIGKVLGKDGLQKSFTSAKDAVGRIWDKIKGPMVAPIKFIVNTVINDGILGAMRKVAGFVGLGDKVPTVSFNPKGYRRGGPLHGPGSTTSDSFMIRASNNEHMLTAEEVRKFGGHRRVEAWRKAVRTGRAYDTPPGFAAGGAVMRPVSGGFGAFPSYPGHTGVDFPVGTGTPVHAAMAGIIKTVRYLTYSYGRHIIESLPNLPGNYEAVYAHLRDIAVKPGQRVGLGQVIGHSDNTGNSTGPHLHFTLQHPGGSYVNPTSFLNGGTAPAGGGGGDLGFDPVARFQELAAKAMDRARSIATSPLGQIVAAMPKALVDAGKEKLSNAIGMVGSAVGGALDKVKIMSILTTALGMNGLPLTQLDNWYRQVMSESGGRPGITQQISDVNSASGNRAQGLLQVIPPTFAAYRSHILPNDIHNALSNAYAGMNYAKHRYGNLESVIGHGHGYDAGGWLQPGITMAVNKTGQPEPVLTPNQWAALRSNRSGPATVNVHLHGVIDSASAAREIDQLLTRNGRLKSGVHLASRTRSR